MSYRRDTPVRCVRPPISLSRSWRVPVTVIVVIEVNGYRIGNLALAQPVAGALAEQLGEDVFWPPLP